jgi:hypothetical protein
VENPCACQSFSLSEEIGKRKKENEMSTPAVARLIDEATYLARGEERAYVSDISNVVVGPMATQLKFDYELPPQGTRGKVRIWTGVTVPSTGDPFYEAPLPSDSGTVTVSLPATSFTKGAYVIAISVDGNRNSIAATAVLINGHHQGGGGSSIFVISKLEGAINTVFNDPPNITAGSQLEYAVIYEGRDQPGQGEILARAKAPLDDVSGIITVTFDRGTLVSGRWYNVCLNAGPSLTPFAAAYTFKYLL